MLLAYERAAPDMAFTHYAGIGELPHFDPDLDGEGKPVPREVARLRDAIAGADVLVISTPEYVHALPGSFKNALDWLVSDPAFIGKPVVIVHGARGSSWALDSLREVLRTMSAEIVEDAAALLPLGTNQIDDTAILARDDLRLLLLSSAAALRAALDRKAKQEPEPTPACEGFPAGQEP